ncbi:tRNA lysidine(34) synthetase TilS [Streptococcus sp. CSL10205-OR2]|uniref:tRNA lysidine(34) synthetase TilS n=1 Tax=Streptococcus sp. CSL10205-OR2 TaxID=2980558 RepID=UPI0021D9572D|nr:tRNA lysidine(34) synthetase TilS [Streptococcus sp. CSL10205-OR2]MCU9533868.1 tRNA lysidine(34) synthetase TilS [Streptococcus sp. CSL10205-OR2]
MNNQQLLKIIQKKSYFSTHNKVLIAVSGGSDSMALLQFLYAYKKVLEISIAIAHVNHNQRLASKEEENYLKEWATNHEIPIYISHFKEAFSEERARNHRYTFFKQIMSEHGYTALVTAHHADDQAETILMKLLRGSRLMDLTGIKERQPFFNGELIRPFLTIKKKDLPQVFHFEDASNNENTFLRNRIRNVYLPSLQKENPQLSHHLIETSREINLLKQALQSLTKDISTQNCQVFLSQDAAVQCFLLQTYLEQFVDLNLSKNQFEDVLHIIKTKANYSHHLKNNYYLIKDYQQFTVKKIDPKTDSQSLEKVLEYGNNVTFGKYRFSFSDKPGNISLTSQSPMILRHRKPGDKIQLGNHSKKIRRLFIDGKYSFLERQNAIIGEQDGFIVFIMVGGDTYLRNHSNNDIMIATLNIEKIKE